MSGQPSFLGKHFKYKHKKGYETNPSSFLAPDKRDICYLSTRCSKEVFSSLVVWLFVKSSLMLLDLALHKQITSETAR